MEGSRVISYLTPINFVFVCLFISLPSFQRHDKSSEERKEEIFGVLIRKKIIIIKGFDVVQRVIDENTA